MNFSHSLKWVSTICMSEFYFNNLKLSRRVFCEYDGVAYRNLSNEKVTSANKVNLEDEMKKTSENYVFIFRIHLLNDH